MNYDCKPEDSRESALIFENAQSSPFENYESFGFNQRIETILFDKPGLEDVNHVKSNRLITLDLSEGVKQTVFSLSGIYPAGDLLTKMRLLNFEVYQNDNPSLVKANIDTDLLILDYADREEGVAKLTIRGTYLDGQILDTPFKITIDPTEVANHWLPVFNKHQWDKLQKSEPVQEVEAFFGGHYTSEKDLVIQKNWL